MFHIHPDSEATDRSFHAPSLPSVAIRISFAILSPPFESTVSQKRYQLNICGGYIRASVARSFPRPGMYIAVCTSSSWIRSRFLFNIRRNCPGLIILCVAPQGEGVEGTKTGRLECVSSQCGTLRKRSGRALLTGASMRLFDTSSDKRPPYYLPIAVSSSLASSTTAATAAAASPCRERFPLIDFWNFPFTYSRVKNSSEK